MMPHEPEQSSQIWLTTWSSKVDEVEHGLVVISVSSPFPMEIKPKKVNHNDDKNHDQHLWKQA